MMQYLSKAINITIQQIISVAAQRHTFTSTDRSALHYTQYISINNDNNNNIISSLQLITKLLHCKCNLRENKTNIHKSFPCMHYKHALLFII